MTLLLSRADVEDLIDPLQAIRVTEAVVLEELAGTTVHTPPFGGAHAAEGGLLRLVGGGLAGLGRMGIRAGLRGPNVALVYDMSSWDLLAIVGYPFSNLRVGASMALAARYLARPDAAVVGLLGSGRNALSILECLRAVRPIERVSVFSPTPEHRDRFARRATEVLGIPVNARRDPPGVVADADIIALATNSATPVITADQLPPGVHVTSMGVENEIDASLYYRADQIVASSVDQEIVANQVENGVTPTRLLERLLAEGQISRERLVNLGAIVSGAVAARNGPGDVTLYRESRGGTGDIALAHFAYERARDLGRGVEFNFR